MKPLDFFSKVLKNYANIKVSLKPLESFMTKTLGNEEVIRRLIETLL